MKVEHTCPIPRAEMEILQPAVCVMMELFTASGVVTIRLGQGGRGLPVRLCCPAYQLLCSFGIPGLEGGGRVGVEASL